MKNPKLLDGILMLNKEEWISFRRYVLMYCTKTSDNYKLIDYLFSIRNSLEEVIDIERIKSPMFDKMTKKSFSNLMSRVFIWFEEWLVWYENKKDEVTNDIQLVKFYNRKGVYGLANKTYRRVEKKLMNRKQLDLRKYQDLYLLHQNHYFSDNPVKYERKEEILETLISYYVLQFKEQALLYIAEMENWGRIQSHDFSEGIKLFETISALIDDTEVCSVMDIIRKMVVEFDEDSFLDLRDTIYSGRIDPKSDLYVIATFYMVGFSMKLWNNNKLSDPQLVLDAYDFGVRSGVYFGAGKVPFVRFINLVSTLGFIKTSEKTYAFIDKYKHLVSGEREEAIQAIGYAQLKFVEEKFDEIIPILIGKKYNTWEGKIRSAALELVGLYYDRKVNYTLLVNRVNNYKRVLRTYGKKRSDNEYNTLLNFVKVLELLVRRDFIKLTINIDNFSPILYKKWILKELKAGQN